MLERLNVIRSFGIVHVCQVHYHRTEVGETADHHEGRLYLDTNSMSDGSFAMQTIHAYKRQLLTWQAYYGEVDMKKSHLVIAAAVFKHHFPDEDIAGFTDYIADPDEFIKMMREV